MNRKRAARRVVVLALVVTFAWTVWPTPYRYFHWEKFPARENRFTGRLEWITFPEDGWRDMREEAKPAPVITLEQSRRDREAGDRATK